jgi:hypothetical protein
MNAADPGKSIELHPFLVFLEERRQDHNVCKQYGVSQREEARAHKVRKQHRVPQREDARS